MKGSEEIYTALAPFINHCPRLKTDTAVMRARDRESAGWPWTKGHFQATQDILHCHTHFTTGIINTKQPQEGSKCENSRTNAKNIQKPRKSQQHSEAAMRLS